MLKNLFKKKKQETNREELIGRKAELIHDSTVFQYGTVMIDNERHSVRLEDGSELSVGHTVEVVAIKDSHLIVRKIDDAQV